jgi:hypothetical protein
LCLWEDVDADELGWEQEAAARGGMGAGSADLGRRRSGGAQAGAWGGAVQPAQLGPNLREELLRRRGAVVRRPGRISDRSHN